MNEKIEVRYSATALGNGVPVYHKYIVYTDSTGKEFYARGGPGYLGPGAADGGLDEASTSKFGNIKTSTGEYTKVSPDWDKDFATHPDPREDINVGPDLSSEWQKIVDAMKDIDARNIPYDPVKENSNATVDEALRRAGLPEPKKDGPSDYWSPGSGTDLPGGGDTASGGGA